jgi:hypothetical protein
MDGKMLFCFTNIFAEILFHVLGYGFCTQQHILSHFFQMLLQLNVQKLISIKAALLFCQKCGCVETNLFNIQQHPYGHPQKLLA